ncbi:MAG TPA: MoxR family ATPase [Nitrospiria bacterium]
MDPFLPKVQILQDNIEQIIRGKTEVVRLALTTLFAGGHLLIEDVPGVGKTTLAHSIARSLDCTFRRIQFTSDLLPADILGVTIYNQKSHAFEFKPGPIFANIILADEINRTTPKTQSSLLEAMNEAQISVDNTTHSLPKPFMVLATQNPMEYHGTYPLPESQLDRFMMRINVGYPDLSDEKSILSTHKTSQPVEDLKPVLTVKEVLELQEAAANVRVEEDLLDYILSLARSTRESDFLALGVSTRGALALRRAAQAYALIEGRTYCIPDDIKQLAPLVFSHRVVIHSRLDTLGHRNQDAVQILEELVGQVPVPT